MVAERKDYIRQVEQAGEYETVASSQTAQALGANGIKGDWLSHLIIVPANTSPGVVSIKDGSDSAITVFTGGASSINELRPIIVPIRLRSRTGGWQITTGADVSLIAVGNFS